MKCDGDENGDDDKVELVDGVLAIKDGRNGCDVQQAADNLVVEPKMKFLVNCCFE